MCVCVYTHSPNSTSRENGFCSWKNGLYSSSQTSTVLLMFLQTVSVCSHACLSEYNDVLGDGGLVGASRSEAVWHGRAEDVAHTRTRNDLQYTPTHPHTQRELCAGAGVSVVSVRCVHRPMFSPPQISICVSYIPRCSNQAFSTANSPPAMAGVLSGERNTFLDLSLSLSHTPDGVNHPCSRLHLFLRHLVPPKVEIVTKPCTTG